MEKAPSSVFVAVRVRPVAALNSSDAFLTVEVNSKDTVTLMKKRKAKKQQQYHNTERKGSKASFKFDRAFGSHVSNAKVFQEAVEPLVHTVMDGCNASVFAFGATSAGKTYTMLGNQSDVNGEPGIMILTCAKLFEELHSDELASFRLQVSYAEVYNESVYDLVRPKKKSTSSSSSSSSSSKSSGVFPSVMEGRTVQASSTLSYTRSKDALALRETTEGDVEVKGLSWHSLTSVREVSRLLRSGNANRSQSPTDANQESSRSHAVFTLRLDVLDALGCVVRRGKLSMVDLAGSEQYNARHAEGASINKSLLALSNCINALSAGGKFIPFRASKLTRLLSTSLGGNCKTVMLCNINPTPSSFESTQNTLLYATRAKNIKGTVTKNDVVDELRNAGGIHHTELTRVCSLLEERSSLNRRDNKALTQEEYTSGIHNDHVYAPITRAFMKRDHVISKQDRLLRRMMSAMKRSQVLLSPRMEQELHSAGFQGKSPRTSTAVHVQELVVHIDPPAAGRDKKEEDVQSSALDITINLDDSIIIPSKKKKKKQSQVSAQSAVTTNPASKEWKDLFAPESARVAFSPSVKQTPLAASVMQCSPVPSRRVKSAEARTGKKSAVKKRMVGFLSPSPGRLRLPRVTSAPSTKKPAAGRRRSLACLENQFDDLSAALTDFDSNNNLADRFESVSLSTSPPPSSSSLSSSTSYLQRLVPSSPAESRSLLSRFYANRKRIRRAPLSDTFVREASEPSSLGLGKENAAPISSSSSSSLHNANKKCKSRAARKRRQLQILLTASQTVKQQHKPHRNKNRKVHKRKSKKKKSTKKNGKSVVQHSVSVIGFR